MDDLRRIIYDLAAAATDLKLSEAIEQRGLRFEYRVVTSLGGLQHPEGNRPDMTLPMAQSLLELERNYQDSLRNRAPEFRQARISALRIERRIVGAWE